MFLKKMFKPSASIKVRITLLYSALFILSSTILFISIYVFIATKLTQHDRELILTEQKELSAQYNRNGLQSIEELLERKRTYHRQHPFFVRVADSRNTTLGLYLPAPWTEFNTDNLQKYLPESETQWIKLQALGGGHYLEVASRHLGDGNWIQVGMSSIERDKILERLRSTFFVVVGVMVVFGIAGGWVFACYFLKPIHKLIASINSVASGEMTVRVPLSGKNDELDELATQFNKMLDKIEQLLRAMKDCLDNVAHDVRTPVMRLRIISEKALAQHQAQPDHSQALISCVRETERIEVMLNTLLNISEAASGVMQINYQNVAVQELVENVADAYLPVAEENMISIDIDGESTLRCALDPDRISQVLANLLDNAIKYTPRYGKISIGYCRCGDNVIIQVKDTGVGIPNTDLERIWERLYRGEQSRKQSGLGLGLSQARAIVEAHKGIIEVASEPGVGTIFTVTLQAVFDSHRHISPQKAT